MTWRGASGYRIGAGLPPAATLQLQAKIRRATQIPRTRSARRPPLGAPTSVDRCGRYGRAVTGNLLHGWRVEEYGHSRDGVALRAFSPEGSGPTAGLLVAAQHGEEAVTALLARRLLERVPGDATRWVVVPVANPDGLINGTRQNAAGVDLNRNFPAATWRSDDSFTYPPGIEDERRVIANRTNLSTPGEHPGSEPETQALMSFV